MIYSNIFGVVGNTPIVNIKVDTLEDINFYAKLEMFNPTGSVKDRAASYVINHLLENNVINKETVIMESSSGNFGVALSAYCKSKGLKFYCVIDKNISKDNEKIIDFLSEKVFKVDELDESGGYLLNRLKKIKELELLIPNSYWINQYASPLNAEAYYSTLGTEIINSFEYLDYCFIGVSSGGTITGVSQRIKEKFPEVKIIAVDIEGSLIFNKMPKKRSIPGIGSSMKPKILEEALIDDVVIVTEEETIKMCHYLLQENSIFAGGSSGSVLAAAKKYFGNKSTVMNNQVLLILPDRGDRYTSTIYNPDWYNHLI
ncbi:2,3-diaminopropionate biosynthesis protein SbnA [Bacillus thuringiensis]|uniref:2,3-diaminopropionate biosynthesis protein SbnA n=1 Tax=Bacillus tropicus TaxID=2026188 RepID=UPI0035D870B8